MGTYGKRLEFCRNLNGMNQRQAAKAAGVSQTAISNLEKDANSPKIDVVELLAKAYGLSLDFVLGRTDESIWLVDGSIKMPSSLSRDE